MMLAWPSDCGTCYAGDRKSGPPRALQAAVLRPQLRHLSSATHYRTLQVSRLRQSLDPHWGLRLLATAAETAGTEPAYYKIGMDYDAERFGLPRGLFVAALQAEGIAVATGFRALHCNRSPSRYRAATPLTHAEAAHHRCILIHHPVLLGSPNEVLQIAQAVDKIYRYRHLLVSSDLSSLGNNGSL
ncbi:MAG: DegT/DnrJ/EryC1/StrS family aminotransferase [Thermogemmata sp.]|nr:DegT/DnrJ/EryC1/StrS family aminotransferase [Thermogemmata sp.]